MDDVRLFYHPHHGYVSRMCGKLRCDQRSLLIGVSQLQGILHAVQTRAAIVPGIENPDKPIEVDRWLAIGSLGRFLLEPMLVNPTSTRGEGMSAVLALPNVSRDAQQSFFLLLVFPCTVTTYI